MPSVNQISSPPELKPEPNEPETLSTKFPLASYTADDDASSSPYQKPPAGITALGKVQSLKPSESSNCHPNMSQALPEMFCISIKSSGSPEVAPSDIIISLEVHPIGPTQDCSP